jgi:hypothetical protein
MTSRRHMHKLSVTAIRFRIAADLKKQDAEIIELDEY